MVFVSPGPQYFFALVYPYVDKKPNASEPFTWFEFSGLFIGNLMVLDEQMEIMPDS
jgi:hypothetical protein